MSEQIKDGGPAFPVGGDGYEQVTARIEGGFGGMTMRQYYTASALQGLLANPGGPIQINASCGWGFVNCSADEVAGLAMDIADAVIVLEAKHDH